MIPAGFPDDVVARLLRRHVVTTSPRLEISSVVEVMRLGRLRALPVVDQAGMLRGSIAFVDCCDRIARVLKDDMSDRPLIDRLQAALAVPVEAVMTSADQIEEIEAELTEVVQRLGDARWGHLCVIHPTPAGPKLIGLLTESDLLRHLMLEGATSA
ncbi:MAG: CBS domain-containing protein [Deltaproteobacteria bacterium]|nr:CBS domain-containing protein [Deltaproteobacteria bacterium]MBW2394661.1 CBS domain-containing protein [Deltaproteobacteria bacterium]